jgi:hypothetical protein
MPKQSPEERKLAAKRARAWKLYRITLEEQDKVEDYQRWNPDFAALLTKGDPKEKALLFNDHSHITGLYRGRLAYLINKALGVLEGAYKDRTATILRALARYLDSPPALEIIGPRYGMLGRAKLNKRKPVYGSPDGPIKSYKKAKRK